MTTDIETEPTVADLQVGDGATICLWSDRKACTVIARTARTITVQGDRAVRVDNNGMSECQQYEYHRNPEAGISTYSLRKNGRWVRVGDTLNGQCLVAGRHEFYDYAF
jgi:hypothetical protein